jgi:endonuclease I
MTAQPSTGPSFTTYRTAAGARGGANPEHVSTIYARQSAAETNFVEGRPEVAWDREHVVPQTFGARSDLHNIFPSMRFVNNLRGHLYFDDSDKNSQESRYARHEWGHEWGSGLFL